MKEEALLLSDPGLSLEADNAAKVLHFFGVPWRATTITEFLGKARLSDESSVKSRVLCSSDTFLGLIRELENDSDSMPPLQERVHSVFIYAGADRDTLQELARILIENEGAVLSRIDPGAQDFVVSGELDDFCGVMAGIRVTTSKANTDGNLVLSTAKGNLTNIISCGDSATFLKLEYKGVPLFLATSKKIIDIQAELTSQNFDVREHFLSAVPLVLYVKWAFRETCWNAPEVNACLIIDDPLLKPRHGFVDFQELLSLMKRHSFSTNIAFIPWNWRRSAPEVVRLFRENPERFSVSVHGCDHTRAEFGSSNEERLYWKTEQALERMNRHEAITGIPHDPVMVFPQGIFSEVAMSALKGTDLIASVNNDIISADPCPRTITVSDVWDVAVMRYSFPLFTRRYPWEGIENFAFDALLGKPAIAVIHHDYCSDHCERLVNFVQQVNAVQCAPAWHNLGDVVRRSCRQREISPGTIEVEMYGTELRLENRFQEPKRFLIRRRECEPSAIHRICAGSQEIAWKPVEGHIDFEVALNPGESKVLAVRFRGPKVNGHQSSTLYRRAGTALRRHLCEARDNYFVPGRYRISRLLNGRADGREQRAEG